MSEVIPLIRLTDSRGSVCALLLARFAGGFDAFLLKNSSRSFDEPERWLSLEVANGGCRREEDEGHSTRGQNVGDLHLARCPFLDEVDQVSGAEDEYVAGLVPGRVLAHGVKVE